MSDKLAAALEHASQGYRVFPLVINGKTPVHDGNWRKIASSNPARITELWTCPVMGVSLDYNIGIALDHTTLVVDTDNRDGKQGSRQRALLEAIYSELPKTYTVDSANGGTHEYFTVEDSSLYAKKLDKDIDLKGEGGYVVAPGSTIEDRAYRARPESGQLKADLPAWVRDHAPAGRRDRLNDVEPGQQPAVDLDTAAAVKRATEYLAKAAPDSGTFKVAARVKDFGISRETCLDLLMEHWPPAEAKGQEHVSVRVDNAYSYGQNAPGIASPEAEFEAVHISETPPPRRKGLFFAQWKQAEIEMDRPYLIDEVLESGSMIVTYGDSNTGKTFIALDQAYHIAAGKPWNGHAVRQGGVVYVASEGGTGFYKRIEALKRHFGREDIPFFTVPCLVDLYADNGNTRELIKLVAETEKQSGVKTALIVIDTLARAMGGGDENASTDMGKFVANCDRIRAATGAALNIVHHTGKDKARGARGSSALRAATDTEIEIDAGTMTMMKQRDAGKFQNLRFTLDVVEVGRRREDDKPITSCVVRWLRSDEFSDEVSPLADQMYEVLEKLLAAKRDEISEDETIEESDKTDKLENVSVDWKTWEKACLAVLTGARGKPLTRPALYPLRQELSDTRKIKKTSQNQWLI